MCVCVRACVRVCIYFLSQFLSALVVEELNSSSQPLPHTSVCLSVCPCRLVYRWFLFIHRTSTVLGVVGYILMMLIFSGLIFVLKSNADYVMEVSLLLMFYGVYYGVLGRDIAEMCVDFMAASMTVRHVVFCGIVGCVICFNGLVWFTVCCGGRWEEA